jgi:predicted aconitase
MHLNKEENQMLEGAYGEVVQKALELLVSIGACFDAEKLIPIRSGHLLANLNGIGRAGASYIHEIHIFMKWPRRGESVPFLLIRIREMWRPN